MKFILSIFLVMFCFSCSKWISNLEEISTWVQAESINTWLQVESKSSIWTSENFNSWNLNNWGELDNLIEQKKLEKMKLISKICKMKINYWVYSVWFNGAYIRVFPLAEDAGYNILNEKWEELFWCANYWPTEMLEKNSEICHLEYEEFLCKDLGKMDF